MNKVERKDGPGVIQLKTVSIRKTGYLEQRKHRKNPPVFISPGGGISPKNCNPAARNISEGKDLRGSDKETISD